MATVSMTTVPRTGFGIDDTTGKIIRDNYRIDRVLVDKTAVAACDSIADVAQAFVDSIE